MKETIISIAIIIGIILGAAKFIQPQLDFVTNETFEEAHEILNKRIDSLQTILNDVQVTTQRIDVNVDSIKNEIEDLQKGQEIIFNEVKKKDISFWSLFN